MISERWREPLGILSLAYIGWGVGDTARMTFSRLEASDLVDAAVTFVLVAGGFWAYKIGFRFIFERFEPQKRAKNLLALVAIVYALAFLVNALASRIAYGAWWDAGFFFYTTPFFTVFSILILAFLRFEQLKKMARTEAARADHLVLESPRGRQIVPLAEVVMLLSQEKTTFVLLQNGEKRWLEHALQHWENALPEADFFRLNRQCLASRQFIKGYENAEHQKLEVVWRDDVAAFSPRSRSAR